MVWLCWTHWTLLQQGGKKVNFTLLWASHEPRFMKSDTKLRHVSPMGASVSTRPIDSWPLTPNTERSISDKALLSTAIIPNHRFCCPVYLGRARRRRL